MYFDSAALFQALGKRNSADVAGSQPMVCATETVVDASKTDLPVDQVHAATAKTAQIPTALIQGSCKTLGNGVVAV